MPALARVLKFHVHAALNPSSVGTPPRPWAAVPGLDSPFGGGRGWEQPDLVEGSTTHGRGWGWMGSKVAPNPSPVIP